jgi:hypothetical protein
VLSSQQQGYVLPTQPKSVQFKVVDAYSNPIPNANITVNFIASSLPNTEVSWLQSAFGVSAEVAAQMTDSGIAMSGVTASDGKVSFIMYPELQYGLTITNTDLGLSKYVTVNPKDDDYVIFCTLTSQVPPTTRLTQLANSSIYVTEPNTSYVIFNIIYQDTSNRTSALHWNITCLTNRTVVYSHDFGDPDTNVKTDNFTVSTLPVGTEYRAMYDATRSW